MTRKYNSGGIAYGSSCFLMASSEQMRQEEERPGPNNAVKHREEFGGMEVPLAWVNMFFF